ncbi:NAD-dependent epimerase/dehydratase family protein [Thermodesulfobacteriota bacterium]
MVTGGTGFVGSNLVDFLLSEGWEVACPVRDTSALRHLRGTPVEVFPLDQLEARLSESTQFDFVFHLAAATRALRLQDYRVVNVDLTGRLLDLFTPPDHNLKRFVLVSSQAAAGPCQVDGTPVLESDDPRPLSMYGRSKLEAEQLAQGYTDRVPITIVRPPTVFGPRDVDVLDVFKLARFRLAPCLAGPDRLVSIIYVEDLVRGILAAALSEKSIGETYFLANKEPVIWKKFVLTVARVMGYEAIPLPIPLAIGKAVARLSDLKGRLTGTPALMRTEHFEEMIQDAWVCATQKAARDLGWQAETPIEEAIRATEAWYRTHEWL